ncbi:hypothetical protein [Pseudomonas aeruginosa]|uniref:hypothetical protein n=1 Tax=Pseudomonas aeruginosa TaxID=287 RepID=UPI00193E292F|nr:hypothetical protein [Pseudomonas aeruginosa]MBI8222282.1 hypothetical protein [Pseudomonas aeruginosa]MDP5708301.1 hypothetical protein [Pseudomonas aeruginosa]HBO0350729.1 hypothetical protein [Pseudomonas aeruginosa]HCF2189359.1 hypothetical protein [Pseudomonas aeruginosa]
MSNEDWNELDESYRSALSGALETAHPAVEQVGGDERAAFEQIHTVPRGIMWSEEESQYVRVHEKHCPLRIWNSFVALWAGWQARAALASTPVADESPMAKMADALREKARQEQQAYQDRRNQATEWGPMPEGTEADRLISTAPVAHVAGDETSRYLEWAKDRSAWEMPVGTPVYYAALAQPSPTLPPFAEKVLAKLRRFYDCAEDFESGGVDIGRHWLDLLTQLGLLNRVQRSPALWEISQQGEDLLGTPHPSPAQAEKAEAERQEVVDFNPYRYHAEKIRQRADGAASAYEAGRSALGYMEDIAESALIVRNGLDELSAQHERITAKLHDALDESDGDRWKLRSERDAAMARVAEYEAQAQHSVPGNAAALVRAEAKKYSLNAAGMLDSGAPEHAQTFAIVQLLSEFDDEEAESHWEAIMAYSDFRTSDALFRAAELLAAAPGKEGV